MEERMIWTAVAFSGIVAIMIVAILTGTPAPLQDDETNWP
jgi:hypothetical protein